MACALRVDPSWLAVDNIKRRSNLSVEEFIRDFETPGVPVVITDVVPKWAAFEEWKIPRLRERYGDTKFRVSATVDMKLVDFLDYCERSTMDNMPVRRPKHQPLPSNCSHVSMGGGGTVFLVNVSGCDHLRLHTRTLMFSHAHRDSAGR